MLTLFKPHDDEAQPDFLGYVAHELADLLPMIDGVNFENLKVDIAKNGILEPILLFEDRILDGRNRYRAGKAVGHSFAAANFRMFDGTYAEAEAYVFSTNFLRRQMTNAQKQEVIRKMIEKYPSDAIVRLRDAAVSPHMLALALSGRKCSPQVPIRRSSLTSVRRGMRSPKSDVKNS